MKERSRKMAFTIEKVNPFLGQTDRIPSQKFSVQPLRTSMGSPAAAVSFGYLAGRTQNGLGSLLQLEKDKFGLGKDAIVTKNGEVGRKLFIHA